MTLALASKLFHGAACVLCLIYAYTRRRLPERQSAFALAFVWCAWFVLGRLCSVFVHALPSQGAEPLSGLRDRTFLALDTASHFAWPALFLAWVRWCFQRSRTGAIVLAWIAAFAIPTIAYPAIRGESFFRYAGALHLAAFALEIAAIVAWIRRREPPQAPDVIAIAAAPICALPALPFLASEHAREDYRVWMLRGFIALHLWTLAVVGGELWNRFSRGSLRRAL